MRKFPLEELVIFLFVIIFVLKWILQKFSRPHPPHRSRDSSRPLMGQKPWKQNRQRSLQKRMEQDHSYSQGGFKGVPERLRGETQRLFEESNKGWQSHKSEQEPIVEVLINGKRFALDAIPREQRTLILDELIRIEESEILGMQV